MYSLHYSVVLEHLLTVTIRAVFTKLYFIVKKSLPSFAPSSFSVKLISALSSWSLRGSWLRSKLISLLYEERALYHNYILCNVRENIFLMVNVNTYINTVNCIISPTIQSISAVNIPSNNPSTYFYHNKRRLTCGEVDMRGRGLMNSSQGERLVSLFGSHPGGLLIPVGLGDFFR